MLEDPHIRPIDAIAGRHTAIVNDLYSYQREVFVAQQKAASETSKTIVNAIVVVMHDQDMDEREAINYLQGHVSQLEDDFWDAVQKAKLCYSGKDLEILQKYSNAVEVICAGNAKWSEVCGRYNRFA